MSKLKQINFFYGAILNAILEKNPDCSPTLILADNDTRQVYKVLTDNSPQDYILFFKHSSCRTKDDSTYSSWTFSFSDSDKELLKTYNRNNPIFICLLCLQKNKLQDSEVAILTYEEYLKINNKNTFTIGLEKRKRNFLLFLGDSRARADAYLISRDRIAKSLNFLLK